MKTKNFILIAALAALAPCAQAQGLLSTLGDTVVTAYRITSFAAAAQQFTTGNQSLSVNSVSVNLGDIGAPLGVSFYSNGSGDPGSLLPNGTLTGPARPIPWTPLAPPI